MTKLKTSDLLDAAALEMVAGGMTKDPTKPIIPPTTVRPFRPATGCSRTSSPGGPSANDHPQTSRRLT